MGWLTSCDGGLDARGGSASLVGSFNGIGGCDRSLYPAPQSITRCRLVSSEKKKVGVWLERPQQALTRTRARDVDISAIIAGWRKYYCVEGSVNWDLEIFAF